MDIEYIKIFLKENKIKYADLSLKSNIPLPTIKLILSGKTKNPRRDTINAIEKALGFTTDYKDCLILYNHKGEMRKFDFVKENYEHILNVCQALTKDVKK